MHTTINYLALGDSYTIGETVDVKQRFPQLIIESLSRKSIQVGGHHLVAKTGWTVEELETGIQNRKDLLNEYDLVTLLIGVNNQYRGHQTTVYEEQFPNILNKAIQFAGGKPQHVIVVSIPDYAYTPFGGLKPEISQGIDAYNKINRHFAIQAGTHYVDITPISREDSHSGWVARDALHPSANQYQAWVNEIMRNVKWEELF